MANTRLMKLHIGKGNIIAQSIAEFLLSKTQCKAITDREQNVIKMY